MIIWLTAGAFVSGSLMFSYWLGLLMSKNLKTVGDGNPGALNLWKASGYKFGLAGIVLDFLKGYLPVYAALGLVQGLGMIPIALAPIAGHAFSPFLKGKGGKAIAVTFGVWSGLTMFEVSLAYAVIMAVLVVILRFANRGGLSITEADGLQVVTGMLLVGVYLYARSFTLVVWWVWLGTFVLLVYTHRREVWACWNKIKS
ncbi:glycerol-3-phosphate acyltransferase [Paenibacillus aestuarii]|uniref:Glycerol-3-phosphate acyltransferase n=1 Tax=Paenibacillus aestuarii TaxID=516965 RepID=A0ABW0KDD4_9BACL|nr:glycerol-3-phosphate acyltransferase [Paenibacillus aestuarii]